MRALVLMTLLLGLLPGSALAWGPGVHIREAEVFLELLMDLDPSWEEAASAPMAGSYLHLGSISPDFSFISNTLVFGHSKGFSYHLIDRSHDLDPIFRMFAIGHLAHITGDASAESFVVPALFGAAPIGMVDLFSDGENSRGESEAIVESFGDLIMGDWEAVVHLAYDFRYDGPEAWQRAVEILEWFCQEGNLYYDSSLDCQQVVDELDQAFGPADEFIGAMNRADALAFLEFMLDREPDSLINIFMSSGIASLVEGRVSKSVNHDRELARIRQTALVDPQFWLLYDQLYTDLGPLMALDHFTHRPPDGWPRYNGNAITCGNIQSMMQFLPEFYEVLPGLLVDSLTYTTAEGTPIQRLSDDLLGETILANLQFFSAVDLEAQVRVVVRRDRPGFDTSQDDIVAEATLEVNIEAGAYSTEPRSLISVPFTADPEDALGFTLDLYLNDAQKPWFTTSWDLLWTIDQLPLHYPIYRENFGTYGHWPPSLPLDNPQRNPAVLFVVARLAPDGLGIPFPAARLLQSSLNTTGGANGVAIFSDLEAGIEQVVVQAEGYHSPTEPYEVDLTAGEHRWIDLTLHAIPTIALPGDYWPDPSSLLIQWAADRFQDQAKTFMAQLYDPDTLEIISDTVDVGSRGSAELSIETPLLDGAAVAVRVWARYKDDSTGIPAESATIFIDSSPPVISSATITELRPVPCYWSEEGLPYSPPLVIEVEILEPHSPIVSASWRMGEASWRNLALPTTGEVQTSPITTSFQLDPSSYPLGDGLQISVTNAAQLTTTTQPLELPIHDLDSLCQTPTVVPLPTSAGSHQITGCQQYQHHNNLCWWFLVLVSALLTRRFFWTSP